MDIDEDRIEIVAGPWSGFEINKDGTVYFTEDGVRRKASRVEARRTRALMRSAVGDAIADAAGIPK
jgi:hypothetical protein